MSAETRRPSISAVTAAKLEDRDLARMWLAYEKLPPTEDRVVSLMGLIARVRAEAQSETPPVAPIEKMRAAVKALSGGGGTR